MSSIAMKISSAAKMIALGIASALLLSCAPDWGYDTKFGNMPSDRPGHGNRVPSPETRKVLLLYSAGFNSISGYLNINFEDLKKGWLPDNRRSEDVLLVYSHSTLSPGNYSTPSSPVLMRLYKGQDGKAVTDTLVTYPAETISASAGTLNLVLTYVKENFPAKGYGLLFSSHATGYLPAGFYSDPGKYVFKEKGTALSGGRELSGMQFHGPEPVPYYEPLTDPSLPAVKSIGQDRAGRMSYEIEIDNFAAAIPMKLDYILFDACLMGGIEVAYELREKCVLAGFSQAEVLAEGFDYTTLAGHLLRNSVSDPKKVCEDYFTRYDIQSGLNRSATISLVDCSRLEPVARVCRKLFSKYRSGLDSMDPDKVQRYYRYSYHWFYDLESILTEAGADAAELEELRRAISGCISYKAATPSFIHGSAYDGGFDIDTHCGLSMYLPCHGHPELDKYYRTLAWNHATGLVE